MPRPTTRPVDNSESMRRIRREIAAEVLIEMAEQWLELGRETLRRGKLSERLRNVARHLDEVEHESGADIEERASVDEEAGRASVEGAGD